jgi:hypothetical protein
MKLILKLKLQQVCILNPFFKKIYFKTLKFLCYCTCYYYIVISMLYNLILYRTGADPLLCVVCTAPIRILLVFLFWISDLVAPRPARPPGRVFNAVAT